MIQLKNHLLNLKADNYQTIIDQVIRNNYDNCRLTWDYDVLASNSPDNIRAYMLHANKNSDYPMFRLDQLINNDIMTFENQIKLVFKKDLVQIYDYILNNEDIFNNISQEDKHELKKIFLIECEQDIKTIRHDLISDLIAKHEVNLNQEDSGVNYSDEYFQILLKNYIYLSKQDTDILYNLTELHWEAYTSSNTAQNNNINFENVDLSRFHNAAIDYSTTSNIEALSAADRRGDQNFSDYESDNYSETSDLESDYSNEG